MCWVFFFFFFLLCALLKDVKFQIDTAQLVSQHISMQTVNPQPSLGDLHGIYALNIKEKGTLLHFLLFCNTYLE